MKPHTIAVIGFPQAMALDMVGPMDVFASVNELRQQQNQEAETLYHCRLYSVDGKPFRAVNGLLFTPEGSIHDIPVDQHTTVIIAGGKGVVDVVYQEPFIQWVRESAPSLKRIMSVCTGTFILAQAGLLAGKEATTHWVVCDLLQETFPDIAVNENAIYIKNDHIYTSAGVTTGIDLSLAVLQEDLGNKMPMDVAKYLVLYQHRPGGQRQYSQVLEFQQNKTSFSELVLWLSEHLHEVITVEMMAEKVCMSPRHFSRCFQKESGVSPMRFLNQMRLEKSRSLLEQKEMPVQSVARVCGFQSSETLRRQFHQRYGVSPTQYKERFG